MGQKRFKIGVCVCSMTHSTPLCWQDDAYVGAGARVASASEALSSDVVLKVQPPSPEEVERLKEHARCASLPRLGGAHAAWLCVSTRLPLLYKHDEVSTRTATYSYHFFFPCLPAHHFLDALAFPLIVVAASEVMRR